MSNLHDRAHFRKSKSQTNPSQMIKDHVAYAFRSPNLLLQPAYLYLIDPMSRVPPVVVRLKDNHTSSFHLLPDHLVCSSSSHASHRLPPPQSPHNSCCRQKCFLHRPPPIILFVHQLLSRASSRLNFLELNEGGDCLHSALI